MEGEPGLEIHRVGERQEEEMKARLEVDRSLGKEPLKLPEDVGAQIKEYWENQARGFFPKPKDICLEDIENACGRHDLSMQAISGCFWIIFPLWYGTSYDGQYRCLEVNRDFPEGRETSSVIPESKRREMMGTALRFKSEARAYKIACILAKRGAGVLWSPDSPKVVMTSFDKASAERVIKDNPGTDEGWATAQKIDQNRR